MFPTAHHPSLVDHDGQKLGRFTAPSLPQNFQALGSAEKAAAEKTFLEQTLWTLYEIQTQRLAPNLLHAYRYRDTLPCQLLGIIGSVFDDAEAHVQKLLSDLATDKDAWKRLVETADEAASRSQVPCPLTYSEAVLKEQRDDYAKWEREIERKQNLLTEIGAYTGWDGAVTPHEYAIVRQRIELVKAQFLDRESRSDEERTAWEKIWPFQDDPK
jgi:hypothetical protein